LLRDMTYNITSSDILNFMLHIFYPQTVMVMIICL
jgi:hypothetical protein